VTVDKHGNLALEDDGIAGSLWRELSDLLFGRSSTAGLQSNCSVAVPSIPFDNVGFRFEGGEGNDYHVDQRSRSATFNGGNGTDNAGLSRSARKRTKTF
jgi:hypothetical protein